MLSWFCLLGWVSVTVIGQGDPRSPTSNDKSISLFVPAYFYPDAQGMRQWEQMISDSARVPITAIVNPDSGPGKMVDPNFLQIFSKAKNSRIKLIGYVYTKYAKRPIQEVKQDMETWKSFYPAIQGFFFDEQASGADQVEYYKVLAQFADQKLGLKLIFANPGTKCSEKYLGYSTQAVTCIYEGTFQDKLNPLPEWATGNKVQRLAAVFYNVATEVDMHKCLNYLLSKKVGHIYICAGTGGNPWNALPKYWKSEVDALVKHNHQKK